MMPIRALALRSLEDRVQYTANNSTYGASTFGTCSHLFPPISQLAELLPNRQELIYPG